MFYPLFDRRNVPVKERFYRAGNSRFEPRNEKEEEEEKEKDWEEVHGKAWGRAKLRR